jgi:predicted RNA-binding Zn ribbon-like protein
MASRSSGSAAVPGLKADGTVRLAGSASALLVTLAREAVHLFGSETATRIRQCQSPTCTLYFIDTSRTRNRIVRIWYYNRDNNEFV